MQPKPKDNQNLLFTARLDQILDHNHPLFKLANVIERSEFEQAFGKLYDPGQGRPAKPIRLMMSLHYLKHTFDLGDEVVGHSKNECRLARNHLLGSEGDRSNAILCGYGYNIRRLLRVLIFWLYKILFAGRFYRSVVLTVVNQDQIQSTFSGPIK